MKKNLYLGFYSSLISEIHLSIKRYSEYEKWIYNYDLSDKNDENFSLGFRLKWIFIKYRG